MRVSILGYGWYGEALAQTLLQNGYQVKVSVTSASKAEKFATPDLIVYIANFKADGEHYDPVFFDCDVIVVGIPPKSRHGEGADYLPKIKRIIDAIIKYRVKKVIYISSTAVYGEGNRMVTEANIPDTETETGRILIEAENCFRNQLSFQTTIIRFGGLVGPGRHPGRFFSGKTDIPNGRAPVNLIHRDDCTGITHAVLVRDLFGRVLNAVCSHHPAKMDFYTRASASAKLPLPGFKDELFDWKIVNSALLGNALDYSFKVANWDDYRFDQ
ncbi:MAG TPA: NAD(P)H-binding protein [Mucilaginibacter sp.]|nr:NAD(P)H-binding protein [Mucilaginibacter sp.]